MIAAVAGVFRTTIDPRFTQVVLQRRAQPDLIMPPRAGSPKEGRGPRVKWLLPIDSEGSWSSATRVCRPR